MGILLDKAKVELMDKYHYSENFAEMLAMVEESITDYMGVEYRDFIHQSVMSCEYQKASNPNKSISEFSKKTATYNSVPTIVENNITDINRKITLPNTFNTSNPSYMGLLINQTMRLVRSNKDEYALKNNNLIARRGLETIETDSMGKTIKNRGTGLENGILSCAELAIMRSDYDSKYELTHGNDYERIIADHLMNNLGFKEEFMKSGVTGNTEELVTTLEKNGVSYDELLSTLDRIEDLENLRRQSTVDKDKLQVTTSVLDDYFKSIVAPMISSLTRKMNHSISNEMNKKS